jgi:hypothetical protein
MAHLSRLGVTQVSEYRVYTFGQDRHIAGVRRFVCQNDTDAAIWAKQLADGKDVELWTGDRLVTHLNPMGKAGAVTYEVHNGRMVPKPAK